MKKLFDLRFVIGVFFTLVGVLLLAYSFLSANTDGQSINRWCGSIFTIFGVIMIILSTRSPQSDEAIIEEASL
jgi:cytochrome c biogenesis protein CcdA